MSSNLILYFRFITFLFFVVIPKTFGEAYLLYPTIPDDGVQWKFDQPSRVVAIGDVHADPNALLATLTNQHVIDSNGNWIAGDTHVVFIGDILHRGSDSRFCLDFIARLKKQAEAAGGKVHTLVGNHELIDLQEGFARYLTEADARHYEDYAPPPDPRVIEERIRLAKQMGKDGKEDRDSIVAVDRAMRCRLGNLKAMSDPDSPYAAETRSRNTIIQIGDTLYVHAGLGDWLMDAPPEHIGAINATVRDQIRQWQDYHSVKGTKFPKNNWTIEQEGPGPLWTRAFAGGSYSSGRFKRILAQLGIKHVVIGHTVTNSREIEEGYGGALIKIDTGSSPFYKGKLSALEIKQNGDIEKHNDIPRPAGTLPLEVALESEFHRGPISPTYVPKKGFMDCIMYMMRAGRFKPIQKNRAS